MPILTLVLLFFYLGVVLVTWYDISLSRDYQYTVEGHGPRVPTFDFLFIGTSIHTDLLGVTHDINNNLHEDSVDLNF